MAIGLAGSAQTLAQHRRPLVLNGIAAAVGGFIRVHAAGHRAELTVWALCSNHQPCH